MATKAQRPQRIIANTIKPLCSLCLYGDLCFKEQFQFILLALSVEGEEVES